ncbi:MAG: type II toxin-antitoxin system VapC family toxin [Hymenobacter sp.]|nr:MAG: type II toxin-antitoxin system VapC family toxin [Hymenobacter sp.]
MGPKFLMDTNVVIGFFNATLPPAGQQLVLGLAPAISVITQIELFSSPQTSAAELASLTQFTQAATVFNLLDAAIVQQTIAVRLQKKIKTPDAIIAGTALAHGLTLLTRNVADFRQLEGLVVVNPFEL